MALNLEDSFKTASKAPTDTNAEYSAYLTTLSAAISSAQNQAASLHMILAGDQQAVTALKTFLQSAATDIAKGRTDLAASNESAEFDDQDALDAAQTTFQTSADTATTTLNDQQKTLDPTQQITDFLNALATLSTKAKS